MPLISGLRKANVMSDGPYSSDPTTDVERGATPPSPEAATSADDGSIGQPADGERWAKAPRIVWLLAALLVIGLPTTVGLATFLSPPGPALSASDTGSLGELGRTAPPRLRGSEDVTGSTWVRPAWAETVSGLTVFELAAGSDVSFTNGRLRPNLGISCASGQTDVYVTTGGTAHINPETSGHVVNLSFDQSGPQAQPWIAAHDHRAVFALDGLAVTNRIATARHLRFGFTHYMSGPVVVDFDLRVADAVMASMAEACGWGD